MCMFLARTVLKLNFRAHFNSVLCTSVTRTFSHSLPTNRRAKHNDMSQRSTRSTRSTRSSKTSTVCFHEYFPFSAARQQPADEPMEQDTATVQTTSPAKSTRSSRSARTDDNVPLPVEEGLDEDTSSAAPVSSRGGRLHTLEALLSTCLRSIANSNT